MGGFAGQSASFRRRLPRARPSQEEPWPGKHSPPPLARALQASLVTGHILSLFHYWLEATDEPKEVMTGQPARRYKSHAANQSPAFTTSCGSTVLCLLIKNVGVGWTRWEGDTGGEHIPISTWSWDCFALLTRLIPCREDAMLRDSQTLVPI